MFFQNGSVKCVVSVCVYIYMYALWIQVAARNALRVQFGGSSTFLGGTWIHRVYIICFLSQANSSLFQIFLPIYDPNT